VLDIDDYCAIMMHPFDMYLVYNFYWDVQCITVAR
jgi:hypothetical protein